MRNLLRFEFCLTQKFRKNYFENNLQIYP
uniref:Uncharacterized protein n=1 Tax=Rhizophora mucronata TaxID=61149 RepID=A0A2P2Q5E0_RHIMU